MLYIGALGALAISIYIMRYFNAKREQRREMRKEHREELLERLLESKKKNK